MTNSPQEEIKDLGARAKEFYKEIESEILSLRQANHVLIIGLDPKDRRYWVGETESSILEQKEKEDNKNLVYFMKLSPSENDVPTKLFIARKFCSEECYMRWRRTNGLGISKI